MGLGVLAWLLVALSTSASATPARLTADPLAGHDPSGLIRFSTHEQALARRAALRCVIWPDGVPHQRPAVTRDVVPPSSLATLSTSLLARVDQLDLEVADTGFTSRAYLLHPIRDSPARWALVHAGHGRIGADDPLDGNLRAVIEHLLARGYRTVVLQMPGCGWNDDIDGWLPDGRLFVLASRGTRHHHELFRMLEPLMGGEILRFFLDPVIGVLDEIDATAPAARDVVMIGISGGGWTTHLASALDPRIQLSLAVAGALPLYARPYSPHSHGDPEQHYAPVFGEADGPDEDDLADHPTGAASWLEIFALAAVGRRSQDQRCQLQVLNRHDPCCFSGDLHLSYHQVVAERVAKLGRGRFVALSDASHREHAISDQVIEQVLHPALDDLAGLTGVPVVRRRP